MSPFNTITLLSNGLTLALALGFLLIVLWHDVRKELNQFFGIFLMLVTVWNAGSLIALAVSLVDEQAPIIPLAVAVMELGFTGSSVAVYALIAILVGVHTRRFRALAFLSLFLVLGYQILLIVTNSPLPFEALGDGFFKYRFQPLTTLLYLTFDGTGLYLLWRYRRKFKARDLVIGLTLFITGQSLSFLNPELRTISLATTLCSLATFIVSFAILRQEIITPLAERISQVEAVHRVSLAITSQISLDTVLNEITSQAARWLNADASGIFLNTGQELELATVYNLPPRFTHSRIAIGEGVAGTVAKTQRSVYLENYGRDWKHTPDLPLARETFGSVISVPLIYGTAAIGVLMVIAGRQGRLFQRDDAKLLELLASQAAVAIAHSRLFAEQRELTRQVEAAHSQLETVLSSTENPVIAVDRSFKVIFANPAVRSLLNLEKTASVDHRPITQLIPPNALPTNYRAVLRELKRNRTYIYEVILDGKTYLCHVAQLGRPKLAGWVAILNDVTQLKELDRLKSEMVRMTSHDLKNPLQAAIANVELLAEDLSSLEVHVPDVAESVANISKQLMRMNRIIAGILDLERAKSGALRMEVCDPEQLAANVIEELQYLATDKQVTLRAECAGTSGMFRVDREQFQRALANLVENAIKFTLANGEVILRVRKSDDNILFEVEDNGIGIPEGLQSLVFDRFLRGGQQGQKGAEHISGTGLGLSLVKTVIESHKGSIWLKSSVGKGTTFFVSIPAAEEVEVVGPP